VIVDNTRLVVMSAASFHMIATANQQNPPIKVVIGPSGYIPTELAAQPIIRNPVAIHLRYLSII
tara:strand:+ start:3084 stop:3275 length:192 start_codon:yes stop_codon:yes gene_type:complete